MRTSQPAKKSPAAMSKTFEFNGRTWPMPSVDPVAYQIGIAAIAAEIIEQREKSNQLKSTVVEDKR